MDAEKDNSRDNTITIPLKICNVERTCRKGVIGKCYQQLKSVCKERFEINGDLKLVLEEDGTEIEDDEYIASLKPQTVLMVLKHQEKWTPLQMTTPQPEAGPSTGKSEDSSQVDKATVMSLIEKIREKKKTETTSSTHKKEPPENVRMLSGWMHYSYTDNRYIQKKTTKILPSGGTQVLSFNRNLNYEETIQVLQSKFFPKGKNGAGKINSMESKLGNAKGEEIQGEGFTAGRYFYQTQTQRARIYLLTKSKLFEVMTDSEEEFLPDINLPLSDNSANSQDFMNVDQGPLTGTPTVTFQVNERKCAICCDREVDSFFMPCGHVVCMVCGIQIQTLGQTCPTCRNKIQRVNSMFN